MFIEQPPWLFRALYPQAIFRMDPNERAVYLTFDDGPIPEVTPWVLEILEKHHINVTIRREMGSDIDAACGQLRNKNQK